MVWRQVQKTRFGESPRLTLCAVHWRCPHREEHAVTHHATTLHAMTHHASAHMAHRILASHHASAHMAHRILSCHLSSWRLLLLRSGAWRVRLLGTGDVAYHKRADAISISCLSWLGLQSRVSFRNRL